MKMNLGDAIIHVKEKARHNESTEYDFSHKQLVNWLEELSNYKANRFTTSRKSIEPDMDLPEGPPITLVTEKFGCLEISEEKL